MIFSGLLKNGKPLSKLCKFKILIQNANQIHTPVLSNQRILQRHVLLYSSERHRYLCILQLNSLKKLSKESLVFDVEFHKNWCSKWTKSTETDVQKVEDHGDNDTDKIKKLFPESRVTLKILSDKLPEKIFDIYYKQSSVTPKIGKKKGPVKNDWICSYVFKWPEQRKFESTAVSKKQAAEKCAFMAVSWLYATKHIDKNGLPLLANIQGVSEDLNEPIVVGLDEEIEADLRKMVEVYDGGIKELFKSAHETAIQREERAIVAAADDSASDEDEMSDGIQSDTEELDPVSELQTLVHPVYGRPIFPPSAETLRRRDEKLERAFQHFDETHIPLPIDDYTNEITKALNSTRTLIIAGAAGCGKSTRTPLALLRAAGAHANILVSEPRRVAATGLAGSVSAELGEEAGDSIGYQVRLHAKLPRPPGGSVLFCTSGVLLRRLQSNPGLDGCTHVIADEAHERDINTDVALLLLKRALKLNPQLKLVIMSATLDTEVFTRYFDNCPIIEVPGKAYPVETIYLEDIQRRIAVPRLPVTSEGSGLAEEKPLLNCKEIAQVISFIDQTESEGAILVFLPGWAEIKSVKELLQERFKESTHYILPVHSRLSMSEQAKMFTHAPPGVRKIVLATNIAETSITIRDVTCVVDTGASRENRLRRGASSLELTWISQAAAKQRMGRAGRVQPGRCYKLYTREKEATFLPHTSPEILRVPLDKTVLDCKIYAPNDRAQDFMSQLPEPPSERAIQNAVDDLVELGALDGSRHQRLTSLGRLISRFTLAPRLSCSLLHSAVTGTVSSAVNVVTLVSSGIDVFTNTMERREEIREIKSRYHPTSDHLALRWIQEEFNQLESQEAEDRFCDKLGLRKERMYSVRALCKLHLDQLLYTGIAGPNTNLSSLNRYSEVDELTNGTVLSGTESLLRSKFYVKTKAKISRTKDLFTSSGERAHIGADSVNQPFKKRSGTDLLLYWGGIRSVERRALLPRATTLITPWTAFLFARNAVRGKSQEEWTPIYLQRHKLTIHVPNSQVDLLLTLRSMLWDTFQYFIERDNTTTDEDHDTVLDFRDRLMNAVARISAEAENQQLSSIESDEKKRTQ